MAPKKQQKMSIKQFMNDESLGSTSWADEMDDYQPSHSENRPTGQGQRREPGASTGGGTGNDRYSGYSRADTDGYSSRAQLPVPEKPPYTAHIGNLSFEASQGEIEDFFSGCNVVSVRLVRDKSDDRPKGFGYVEFSTKEGLIKALEFNGQQLAGRNVRISVAEPPKERPDDRTAGSWERKGPLPSLERDQGPRRTGGYERHNDREDGRRPSTFERDREQSGDGRVRDLGNWERKGPLAALPPAPTNEHQGRPRSGDREFRRRSPAPGSDGVRREYRERPPVERQPTAAEQDNQWRKGARPDVVPSTPASPTVSAPTTRPKLELKKRSEVPTDAGAGNSPTPSSDKPNPFGAARPIDTLKREKEVEEKRAAAIAERKAKEKAREEKKAATAAAVARTASEKENTDAAPAGKNFDVFRRGSAVSDIDQEAESAEPSSTKESSQTAKPEEKKVEEKRFEDRKSMGTDNWRLRAAPKEGADGESGWSTVSTSKRGRSTLPSKPLTTS